MKKVILSLIATMLILSACSKGEPAEEKSESRSKQQQDKAFSVMVEKVAPRNLEEYINFTGKLEGITDITLSSQIHGEVVKIYKKLGDWVKKGESIGSIDNAGHKNQLDQAKAFLLAAEATFEVAEMQIRASKKLYKEQNISEAEYVQATSSFKSAKAGLDGAKANLENAQQNLDHSQFTAPLSGYIADMNLEVGQTISVGIQVCTIVDSRQLVIKTGIGESGIICVKKGQQVEIFHDSHPETFIGTITGVGIKPVNGATNYPVEIIMDNPDNKLYAGMVIEGRIQSNIHENVIFTSLNNIVQEYDQKYVFIIEDSIARQREVTIGKKVGENVIITSGIKNGELLVIEGMENLEEGSVVEIRKGL
jgi:membrane fusion protein (multidrug efflux system)